MRLVEAIIQPHHLTAVLVALERVAVERLTVLDSLSYREIREPDEEGLGSRGVSRQAVIRGVILEILVNDDFLDRTIAAISESARTGPEGRLGDGKIFVLPVHEVICIASAERGPGAV